ncbi:Iron-enterobactin transporter [Corynebacterium kutscheri]|uniref:ABC-type enterobactin transport system, permease component n=1 Tax=Corynebacterium kutscheri TaxID=35755 RepID=A0A0F6R089_9CORY|nr:iron chelate uptake ABC transporter family permease subunit [Corynebacterium kutscheri]AKE41587.1 ABC-type enterobactin transport system, permease component [Corynebacterium kutscheri]VEH08868.1 Iron-enterobactin transporter [Corynebacterium kutscheri]VEH09913.1 Iron-enterobactin transporter [Corynebacterium kutscheri]VEH79997.1 Iron-enterobactin transporter [Corynebacterium kutscheri]
MTSFDAVDTTDIGNTVHAVQDRALSLEKERAPTYMLWLKRGSLSIILDRRTTKITITMALITIAVGIWVIGIGAASVSYQEVVDVLLGGGSTSHRLIVIQWRIPRIVAAIVVGIALGIAGSIFQTITYNPLASPDLIGFTMGAQTGILLAVIMFGNSLAGITIFSLTGGLITGAVIYALAARGGFSGLQLILGGIAISAMLSSFNRWLIVHADADTAFGAMKAITGTSARANWEIVLPCAIGIGLIVGATLFLQPSLEVLSLGSELSTTLGVHRNLVQGLLVLLAVGLVAFATIIAGPISFIGLLAPHIARKICRRSDASLWVSGLCGALLLLFADLLSQTLVDNLPVGIVTAIIGGLYFMGLLITEVRRKL